MLVRIFENWKTSLTGIGLSFFQYLSFVNGNFTWKTFLPTLGTLLLGLFSTDSTKPKL